MSIAERIKDKSHPCVKAYRMIFAESLKDFRRRVVAARLYRYAQNPRAFLTASQRLFVSFAPQELMQAEIEWLRGMK